MINRNYKIKTERIIITKERIEHINKRHDNDYNKHGHYIQEILSNSDYILEDIENYNTLLYLKTIKVLNFQVVVKLQTENLSNKSNTIITFWHMRERSYYQILNKHKKIFENIDKDV